MPSSSGPCPSCGRRAEEHPSLGVSAGASGASIGGGWEDEDLGGGLDLSRGGSLGGGGAAASAYAGGGLSLGDDDDPFADDMPAGALELDLPQSHLANAPRPHPSSAGMPAVTPPRAHPSTGGMPAVSASAAGVPDLAMPPPTAPATSAAPPPSSTATPARRAEAAATSGEPPPPSAPAPEAAPPPPPAAPPAPSPAAIIARYPPPPDKVWESPAYAMKVLLRQLELRQDLASLRKRRSPDVPLYEAALKTHDVKTFALGLALICAGLVILTFLVFLRVILRFMDD